MRVWSLLFFQSEVESYICIYKNMHNIYVCLYIWIYIYIYIYTLTRRSTSAGSDPITSITSASEFNLHINILYIFYVYTFYMYTFYVKNNKRFQRLSFFRYMSLYQPIINAFSMYSIHIIYIYYTYMHLRCITFKLCFSLQRIMCT